MDAKQDECQMRNLTSHLGGRLDVEQVHEALALAGGQRLERVDSGRWIHVLGQERLETARPGNCNDVIDMKSLIVGIGRLENSRIKFVGPPEFRKCFTNAKKSHKTFLLLCRRQIAVVSAVPVLGE